MDIDFEIYKGKSFSSLCKDIVKNSEDKKNQVDILISDLRSMIKTVQDAMTVVPLLKEYYDIGIRNDEQIIKLAAIIQRIISGKVGGEDGGGALTLTEEEKKQLLTAVEDTVKNMNTDIPDKSKQIAEIKDKKTDNV
jgi:hypothetical protein